jgi:hypothetical protein
MSSTMKLDADYWDFHPDEDRRVEMAAVEALLQICWNIPIVFAQRALSRGGGGVNAACLEVWCVKLAGVEPEIRHCFDIRERDPKVDMVNKFAATFEAVRSGSLPITSN